FRAAERGFDRGALVGVGLQEVLRGQGAGGDATGSDRLAGLVGDRRCGVATTQAHDAVGADDGLRRVLTRALELDCAGGVHALERRLAFDALLAERLLDFARLPRV